MNPFQRLADWFQRQKDSSSSFLIERALQHVVGKYGRMVNFVIDSQRKTVQCELLLKGEKEPLTFVLQQYELITEPAGIFVIVHKASCSREWMTLMLEDFVQGRKFLLPEKYARLLRMVA